MAVQGRTETALPTGVVTFILTDVEDSTRRWETAPDAMAEAIERHYEVLDEVIGRHGGVRPLEQGEGDSIVAVFRSPPDAVAAALDAQLALSAEAWPAGAEMRVRMALHTGEARLRGEWNYAGPGIIRCARLRGLCRGGQIVISSSTRELVRDALPAGAVLADLGERQLKGIERPERVYALLHRDLGGEWELSAPASTLPNPLSPFVGRERELGELDGALARSRLVTLIGSGGAGKTRMAIEAARRRLGVYPDGAFFVALACVEDPALVDRFTLGALGLSEDGRAPRSTLIDHLRERTALLVLDNCEHLGTGAAELVAALLEQCRYVQILATSREPVGIGGEQLWAVRGLATGGVETDAVQLFIGCARRACGTFTATDNTLELVSGICRALDGMPLAIELAAPRLRMLGLEEIAEGLGSSLGLLRGGPRDAAERHRTMRASLEWSYRLLEERERILYRRLGVFTGGWSLDAAERVCGGRGVDREDVLDRLAGLLDKSLILADEGPLGIRYRMLEPVRQHAIERLDEAAEGDAVRDRHLELFSELSKDSAAEPEFDPVLPLLEVEAANLRAALAHALEERPADAVVLVGALSRFWIFGGHYREGAAACARSLAVDDRPSAERATVLTTAATIAIYLRDLDGAVSLAGQALECAQESGDDRAIGNAQQMLATLIGQVDPAQAIPLARDAIKRLRRAGHAGDVAFALLCLGISLSWQDAFDDARAAIDEAVALSSDRAIGAWREMMLRWACIERGELTDAVMHGRRAEPLAERVPMVRGIIDAQACQIRVLRGEGAAVLADAEAELERAEAVSPFTLVALTDNLARAALSAGDLEAARRWGGSLVADRIRYNAAGGAEVLGLLTLREGEPQRARDLAEVARSTGAQLGNARLGAVADILEGRAALDDGDLEEARRLLQRALGTQAEYRYRLRIPDTLEALGAIAAAEEDWAVAARLLAAAQAGRSALGLVRVPEDPERWEPLCAAARGAAPSAWEEGAGLSLEQATAYVRRGRGPRARPLKGWAALSPTEAQVAELAAAGRTNPQIAAELFISRTTVKRHLAHSFEKLGVANRTELAAAAGARRRA
jgi:predicted ATPase/class 3 adenylate cyclase/DNA-binding CsgD family transcriptional regulator